MEALLHSHDWLNYWPLAIDSTSRPFPLQTLPSSVPLQSASIFRCFPKVMLLTKQNTPLWLSSLKKFQGFLAAPYWEQNEDQISISYYKSQQHTH